MLDYMNFIFLQGKLSSSSLIHSILSVGYDFTLRMGITEFRGILSFPTFPRKKFGCICSSFTK